MIYAERGEKMTREQAINYLKSSGMSDEQIETVVDALTCEDCISRQAVLDKLERPMNWTDSEAELQEQRDYDGFIELVQSMPPVTPQPKMGHWIDADKLLTEITKTKEEYNKYVNADSYFKDGYISALNWFEKLIHEMRGDDNAE